MIVLIPSYKSLHGWYTVVVQNVYYNCCLDFEKWLDDIVKPSNWCQTKDCPMNQYWFRKEADAMLFSLRWL